MRDTLMIRDDRIVGPDDTLQVVKDTTAAADELLVSAEEDTVCETPQDVPGRRLWEKIISAPGWLAVAPVVGLMKAAEYTTAFVYRRDLGTKVYNFLISPDGSRRILPFYASLYGAGVEYKKLGLIYPESRLSLKGGYGLYNRHSLRAEFSQLRLWPSTQTWFGGGLASYTFFPDQSFYGLGNESEEGDETFFAQRTFGLDLSIEKRLAPWVNLSLLPILNQIKISRSNNDNEPPLESVFSPAQLTGVGSSALLGGVSGLARFDTRGAGKRWSRGVNAALQGGFVQEIPWGPFKDELEREDFGLWIALADLQLWQAMPWGPNRVLALRGILEMRQELPGHDIPFYLLSRLGGQNNIRGWTRWRFYDNDLLTLTLDYSFPVWRFTKKVVVDGTIFVDAGQVADHIFSDISLGGFHVGAGFGIQIFSLPGSVMRLVLGFSEEGVQFYLSLG